MFSSSSFFQVIIKRTQNNNFRGEVWRCVWTTFNQPWLPLEVRWLPFWSLQFWSFCCIDSSIFCFLGGAIRIELCSSLSEGGLTPSAGLLRHLKKDPLLREKGIKIFCMIRPRGGDFLYSKQELEVMIEDIQVCIDCSLNWCSCLFWLMPDSIRLYRLFIYLLESSNVISRSV